MRFFVAGIFLCLCGVAFADTTTEKPSKVSSVTYVNTMSNSVALEKPSTPIPEGRALMWIE